MGQPGGGGSTMKRNRTPSDSAEQRGAQLTWAVAANGEPAHISEVENGLKCACACPVCDGALVARQGKIREHHFAHASGEECRHAAETALHLAAKDMLAKRKEIVLPEVEVHLPEASRRTVIAPQRRYPIKSVKVERKTGTIVPDVIVEVSGRQLLVEVTVTHGVDDAKLVKIRELGLSCLEIDLSDAPRDLGREELEKMVVDGNAQKRWLHNVRANEARNRMLAEATLLPSVNRGFAWHVDGCPIPARVWKGNAYANVIDDCIGCEHMLAGSGDVGVICNGFRVLRRPRPTAERVPRPPPEAFEHPEEDDPMRAVGRWLDDQMWSSKTEDYADSSAVSTTAMESLGTPGDGSRSSTPRRGRPSPQGASAGKIGSANDDMRVVRRKLEADDEDLVIALIGGQRQMRRVRRINADTVELWPLGTRPDDTPVKIGPTTAEAEIVEIAGRRIAATRRPTE